MGGTPSSGSRRRRRIGASGPARPALRDARSTLPAPGGPGLRAPILMSYPMRDARRPNHRRPGEGGRLHAGRHGTGRADAAAARGRPRRESPKAQGGNAKQDAAPLHGRRRQRERAGGDQGLRHESRGRSPKLRRPAIRLQQRRTAGLHRRQHPGPDPHRGRQRRRHTAPRAQGRLPTRPIRQRLPGRDPVGGGIVRS